MQTSGRLFRVALTPKDVSLSHLEKFVTVEFHELVNPCLSPYNGRYQNRMSITEEEIGIIADKSGIPLVKVMESMEDIKKDIHVVKKDVDNLGKSNSDTRWMIGIGLTVIGLIIGISFFAVNRTLSSSVGQSTSAPSQVQSRPQSKQP